MAGRSLLWISIALTLLGAAVDAQVPRNTVVAKVPPDIRQAEGFDPAQSAGLFVGVRFFTKDDYFQEVPFAVDDAVDLANLFVRELELIRPDKVVLSLSGEPQKKESQERLARLLADGAKREPAEQTDILLLLDRQGKASGQKGLFVVSFATHGFSDEGSDFLVAADSLSSFIKRTGIDLNETFDVVARTAAPRRLVLLDACRERFTAARGTKGLPMSASFADAIAGARGLAVVSGATLGGFAYDDLERKNGVFTAAVVDGLRGGAPRDVRHFITVRTLADYVNDRVLAWVRDHRPEDAAVSQGISRRIEGVVAQMALAVDAGRLAALSSYRERRDAALDRLRRNLEMPLTGAMYDEMKALLSGESPSSERLELLGEVEALDGTERMRRALAFYWLDRRSSTPVATQSGRRTVRPSAGQQEVTSAAGVDFAWRYIPPGTFQMGSPKEEEGRDNDEKLHEVTLTQGFWMGETEVTQGQWEALTADNPSKFKDCGPECPVEQVSWYEAVKFANTLSKRSGLEECYQEAVLKGLDCTGYRLPTEAEWEYAARAGTRTPFWTGKSLTKDQANCSGGRPVKVRSFSENSWGLHDVHGNVWEWTQDAADLKEYKVVTDIYRDGVENPLNERGSRRVARGGGWANYARNCRSANRYAYSPGIRYGLRRVSAREDIPLSTITLLLFAS